MEPTILGADGRKLSTKPAGNVVLKVPANTPIPRQLVQVISQLTQCNVIVLPTDVEILFDKQAGEYLAAIHKHIHSILNIKD